MSAADTRAAPQQRQIGTPPIVGRPVSPPTSAARSAASSLMPAPPPPTSTAAKTTTAMPGPPTPSSMGGAGLALQQAHAQAQAANRAHPPGKAATGGQSHAHRPVSAMPTPVTHNYRGLATGEDSNVLTAMSAGYAERRASAHPTVPVASQSMHGLPQMAMSPSIDPAIASTAINSGIPVTSSAALAYFAAHPRRQQVHFGNYLLLQTLGEGEFGKVKLGVHKEWGEEVAVKLIKRDKVGSENGPLNINGPPKDPAKMSKVEREIQVLKDVRHPNIVRLYEVIESDRYIGIVLEYASGGELFDHILAHKYLRERDACRLFAQLISGVNYLHQKKVVHRDLKLENLLLDRNRNVIITDFGFANNFEDRRDDLMATSCGSPCYAAPELVVQDGLYAGSAVDVWSCGVILYAMLAGYLPFDDDPANPEGDNINLLYKYIMATPLSFPEYISAEPRDLLSRMLVPDPQRRIDLEGVMAHSWLAPYRDLFKFTVDELERAAIEQQTKKRQVYRQQMVLQQQMQEQQRQQEAAARSGARAGGLPVSSVSVASGLAPPSAKSQRHQSAMATPTSAYSEVKGRPRVSGDSRTPVEHSSHEVAAPAPAPVPFKENTNRVYDPVTALGDARGEPRMRRDERGNFVENDLDAAGGKKVPAGSKPQRHTVQLEYEENQSQGRRRAQGASTDSTIRPGQGATASKVSKKISAPRMTATGSDSGKTPTVLEEEVVPAVPTIVPDAERAVSSPKKGSTSSPSPAAGRPFKESAPAGASPERQQTAAPVPVAKGSELRLPESLERPTSSSRGASNPLPQASPGETPPTSISNRVASMGAGPTPDKRIPSQQASASPAGSGAKVERSATRHRKGMSTDKFFLARLLGNSAGDSGDNASTSDAQGHGSQMDDAASDVRRQDSIGRPGSSRRKAMSLVVGGRGSDAAARDREKANAIKAAKEEKRLTARARKESAVSQASRPPTTTSPSTPKTRTSALATNTPSTPSGSKGRPGTQQGTPSRFGGGSNFSGSPEKRSGRGQKDSFEGRLTDSSSTVGPSSNAAKKVMDWFRKKSLNKGSFSDQPPLPPFEVPKQRSNALNGSAAPSIETRNATSTQRSFSAAEAPRVTVTGVDNDTPAPYEAQSPSSPLDVLNGRSEPLTEFPTGSSERVNVADLSNQDSAAHSNGRMTPSVTTASPATRLQQQDTQRTRPSLASAASKTPSKHNENAMRFHVGAVDQSALTSRSPPGVFAEVCRALFEMGIEMRKEKEEEFKLECIRRKKPTKSLIGATQGLGASIRTSVFPPSQADYERSARAPSSPAGTMSPSQSSSIRNFLRRGSQTASPTSGSIALPDVSEAQAPPATVYGEPKVDGGQEVRFSVEITKIKNLPGLYSLDIRRLRGPLTSYKFLYHNVLMATNLAAE